MFVRENITRLVENPVEFIAKKDFKNMQGFMRLFYLLMVGDDALIALKDKECKQFLRKVKFLVFIRHILDYTSMRFAVGDYVYFEAEQEELFESIKQNGGLRTLLDKFRIDVDLDFLKIRKLFKAFQVFEILSKFKEEKKCFNFRQLHCKILKNEIPFEEFVDQLRKTQNEEINKKSLINKIQTFLEFDDSVLSSLKPPKNTPFKINHDVSFRNLLERMVVACVHKHVKGASLPKHDSSYNVFVMKRFNKWEDLVSNYFDRLLLAKVIDIEHKERRKLRDAKRKLKRVETLIQKVKDFRIKCPLEKRCFPFSQTQLSYSGEDLPTFSKKREMFEFLKLEGYGDDMLTKLESLNLCNVLTYDFKGEFRRNSRYLHGCSLYMQGNLNKSKCAEDFTP
jgi:hypothetical protein